MTVAVERIVPGEPVESELEVYDRSVDRFFVIALTVIATLLRAAWLDRPTLNDVEAHLFFIATDTLEKLLDNLRREPASPLLHSIYWLLGRVAPLNPWVLRALPAAAGALLVPAMYALAKQIMNRRSAVVVAMITTCSAWMLDLSRHATANVFVLLFLVLNLASLLWWLRSHKVFPWLCWVATGILMTGFHLGALLMLALQPLIFLTYTRPRQFRHNRRLRRIISSVSVILFFILGVALVSGATVYYLNFFGDQLSSLTLPSIALKDSTSNLLIGWHSPTGNINHQLLWYLTLARNFLLLFLILGLLPWPPPRIERLRIRRPWEIVVLPDVRFAWERQEEQARRFPQSVWRWSLWLLLFSAIPAYIIYCATTPGALGPIGWARTMTVNFRDQWIISLSALTLILAYLFYWSRQHHPLTRRKLLTSLNRPSQLLLAVIIIISLYLGIHRLVQQVDLHPYISLLPPISVIWPATMMIACILLLRIPYQRIRRFSVFLFVIFNLGQAGAFIILNPSPRIDLLANDFVASQSRKSETHTLIDTGEASTLLASDIGRYYTAIHSNAKHPPTTMPRPIRRRNISIDELAIQDASKSPWVKHLILWDHTDAPTPLDRPSLDPTAHWLLTQENLYRTFTQETWERGPTWRRREFTLESLLTPEQKKSLEIQRRHEQGNDRPTL